MGDRLGVPPALLKKSMKPPDFLAFRSYLILEKKTQFKDEFRRRHREDYYLVQIAHQVYLLRHQVANLLVDRPPDPEGKFEDLFFDFKRRNPKTVRSVESSQSVKELEFVVSNESMKAAYSGCLGLAVPGG